MRDSDPEDGDDIRHMNDSTLPKSRNSNRSATTTTIPSTKKRSGKVLQPGFGLADWNRLLQSSHDLAQRRRGGNDVVIRRDMTREEVAQHSHDYDAWIILHGKVYNIGPYLPYHPGGRQILKSSLGKDATALFEKYHPWVNVEGYVR
jgi:cytochrome b involved in lipid metabolism